MERIVWNGFASEFGQIDIDVTLAPTDTGLLYASVLADLNGSGTFADYGVGLSTQTEWVARNVPIFPGAGASILQGSTFPLIDASVGGSLVDSEVFISSTPFAAQPSGGTAFDDLTVGTGGRMVNGGGKEGSIAGLEPDAAVGGFNDIFGSLLRLVGIEDLKANFTVDPDTGEVELPPDNPQRDGVAECGPTSAANSLRFLARQGNFERLLPATDREIIDELYVNMSTHPTIGTEDPDFISGKLQYIRDNNLPLVQKFQDASVRSDGTIVGTIPTAKFIWDELEASEDVELGFTFGKDDGSADGRGHWVTLVGGVHYTNGNLGVWIHDPDDKGKSMANTQYYDLTTTANGFLELQGYAGSHFIDIAVSESVIPEPSSVVVWSMLGLGIGVATWRRRRLS